MRVEAVIFDIGNVLTRWQPEAFYDRVIGPDRRRGLAGSGRAVRRAAGGCWPDRAGADRGVLAQAIPGQNPALSRAVPYRTAH